MESLVLAGLISMIFGQSSMAQTASPPDDKTQGADFASAQPALTAAPPSLLQAMAQRPLLATIDEQAIRAAIHDVLEEESKGRRLGSAAKTFQATPYESFAEKFAEAKVPDCLHGDALKRQPARILFVNFQGVYAVPFVILAKFRGKCI